jgi:hypothetical protein
VKPSLKGRRRDSVLSGQGCRRWVWSNGAVIISRGIPKEPGKKLAPVLLFFTTNHM